MPTEAAIGVDLGGTKIHFAVVNRDGEILCETIKPTDGKRGAAAVMDTLIEGVAEMEAAHGRLAAPPPLVAIGIGSAGQIHEQTGEVVHALDAIDGWLGTPIKRQVERRFPYPVYVDNDVNVIAVAEKLFGQGKQLEHFVCLALGTGVGGAIIQSGRLLRGAYGGAGEMGHVSVDFNGPRCVCGNVGCLELYASGTGIARLAAAASRTGVEAPGSGRAVDAREVIAAWHREERWASDIMDTVIRALAVSVSGFIHAFNPQAIIVGGGVASSGERFMNALDARVQEYTMPAMRRAARLLPAYRGASSGVIGAAAQHWFEQEAAT